MGDGREGEGGDSRGREDGGGRGLRDSVRGPVAEPGLVAGGAAAADPSPASITTSRPQGLAGRGCGELPPNAARASPAVPRRALLGLCVPSGSWLDGGGGAGTAALPQQTLLAAEC